MFINNPPRCLESEIQRLRNELTGRESAKNGDSSRDLVRLNGEAHESSLPLDFGESLGPKHSNLINKQFR